MRRLASGTAAALLLWSLSVAGPRATEAADPAAPQAPAVTYPLPSGVRFLHTATPGNITSDYTVMTNAASDGRPDALVFATHNWNPGGVGGMYSDRAVGTDFHPLVTGLGPAGGVGRWGLYNEDETAFADGLAYNVMVTPAGDRAFLHTSDVTNTSGNATEIDHAWLNGSLDRIPFIMHNFSPNAVDTGPVYTRTLGVYYDTGSQAWNIFNEDGAIMPAGVSFNVMVALAGANVFTHTATVGNTLLNATLLDHPLANGNRNALILVTQNWNPDGASGVYNNHHVGVFYSSGYQKWAIFNEDNAAMPLGASFSVLIDEAHIYLPLALR